MTAHLHDVRLHEFIKGPRLGQKHSEKHSLKILLNVKNAFLRNSGIEPFPVFEKNSHGIKPCIRATKDLFDTMGVRILASQEELYLLHINSLHKALSSYAEC